ncbi:type IV pilus biogenesis/stability protein PilW [Marinobacter sp.]|uniref:type IV pilus biogenesis/stability protein PilW n=1 Tax=Marinobacter sp. TaxID=50741 RepID=UPI0034A3E11A
MMLAAGCVTVSDSRFAKEEDRDKAVKNYVQLGTAYISQGNLDRARLHLDRALELAPDDAAALSAMALLYSSDGEDELADKTFRKAISSDGDYTRGRVYYGAYLYGERRFGDAQKQFKEASGDTNYSDRASVFFNLGMTEERLDNDEAAANAYRRAVELSRGDAKSLLALSRVLVEAGDLSAASRHYSRLSSLMQQNSNYRHSPESLFTGIRIARYFDEWDRESSLALQLKNNFPDSVEYQQYRVLISNE